MMVRRKILASAVLGRNHRAGYAIVGPQKRVITQSDEKTIYNLFGNIVFG
jgi:hypothetical protein